MKDLVFRSIRCLAMLSSACHLVLVHAVTPQPGLWEIRSQVEGGPRQENENIERRCLAAEAMADPDATFFKPAPSVDSRAPSCSVAQGVPSDGGATWITMCKSPRGTDSGSGNSSFDSEAYTGQQRLMINSPMGTMYIAWNVRARRIGNCP